MVGETVYEVTSRGMSELAKSSFDAGLRIADEHLRQVLLGNEFLVFDGAMGTQMQARGLAQPGVNPDLLNLTNPQAITEIHAAYVAAGAEVITTNTFGANALKLEGHASVQEVYEAAVVCAKKAHARYVAGDIGPTGALLEPLGTLSFDDAYEIFAEQVQAADTAGCDLILIETLADLREAKAALLAAKEHTDLPVFITMTFGEDGRTFLGTPPEVAAEVLSSLGAHAVGINCSLGPDELLPLAQSMAQRVRCPLMVQPNAGMPRMEDDMTVYDVTPEQFAMSMKALIACGANIVGSCCGSSPDFTRALRAVVDEAAAPMARAYEPALVLTSAQKAVVLPAGTPRVAVIGERINPTGKPKLQAALRAGNFDYVVGEAVSQAEAGADVLDVNVGLPELDEPTTLACVVDKLAATLTLPLVFDSSDPEALERAVRSYAGKPLINSVNAKQESLEAVLPLVKKYGCAVLGLTLDETGIPPTAEGRLRAAQRIVSAAEAAGIPREDIVIDCLVMAAATNQDEACEILRAVSLVKEQLGARTALGVSNISFGLPQRGLMNATFLSAAFGAGLDLPILNPLSARYRDVVAAFRVLNGQDVGSRSYIETFANAPDPYAPRAAEGAQGSVVAADQRTMPELTIPVAPALADVASEVTCMMHHILSGQRGPMADATLALLETHDALDVVNGVFIPALDEAGRRFDSGVFFLPQLMASAEAVKAGFDVVRAHMDACSGAKVIADQRTIAVATVKGDIHDIGKNIAKMLLENYGYNVVDLGRDVSPEDILSAVEDDGITLVGLSALMTTTVKAMEQTVSLLHERAPQVRVIVAGAVLTPEYALRMGADYYAKDAAETARIAERFFAHEAH